MLTSDLYSVDLAGQPKGDSGGRAPLAGPSPGPVLFWGENFLRFPKEVSLPARSLKFLYTTELKNANSIYTTLLLVAGRLTYLIESINT